MGISVHFYTFSKKINSTAKPVEVAASYTCIIKEPCGILSPVIGLNIGLTTSPANYNYAFIPTFNRYYFVKEWTFQNALWYATLDVDVLASWRSDIGNSTCYVLRSSTESNGTILDTSYPATGVTTLDETQGLSPWITDSIENGMFVVGVAGQSTTYYLFTQEGLDLFFGYLFSDAYASDLLDIWLAIYPQLKAQTNPLQYITSLMWIPFQTTGTMVESIRVGWVDVPAVAFRVDGSGLRYGQTDWTIHRHPQSSRGSFLNNSPYSNYSIFYPPWGTIPLDSDVVANSSTISAIWGVDLRTGQGTLTIAGGDTHIMSWIHSQVGIHHQVSQVVNKGYGLVNALLPAISAAGNALSGNFAGAAANAISEIGNFAASKVPSATTIGSNGGLDSLRGLPAMQYQFKEIVAEDNMHRGRPLCANRRIDTLSGYIKVANAYISIAATQSEKNAIISYMEGGFYYE